MAGDRTTKQTRHDLSRSVQLYALLIAAIACANVWIYWAQGTRLSLVLAVVAFVCLAGWLLYARRVLRSVDRS